MNSRKILVEQAKALMKVLEESQQQIQLEEGALESIKEQLHQMIAICEAEEDYSTTGQDLISHVFTLHPNITHLVPRDLIWLLGGPCLHYLSDKELDLYNELDERRYQAELNKEPFDWLHEKSTLTSNNVVTLNPDAKRH